MGGPTRSLGGGPIRTLEVDLSCLREALREPSIELVDPVVCLPRDGQVKQGSYISVNVLASFLGTDKTRLHKYIKKMGLVPRKYRDPRKGNVLSHALTVADAKKLIRARREDGYTIPTYVPEE